MWKAFKARHCPFSVTIIGMRMICKFHFFNYFDFFHIIYCIFLQCKYSFWIGIHYAYVSCCVTYTMHVSCLQNVWFLGPLQIGEFLRIAESFLKPWFTSWGFHTISPWKKCICSDTLNNNCDKIYVKIYLMNFRTTNITY